MSYSDVVVLTASGDVNETAALKTSVATSLTPVTYTYADLNGRIGALPAEQGVNRCISATTTGVANAYNILDPIRVTGLDTAGRVAYAEIKLTNTSGGETVQSAGWMARVTEIIVPAQLLNTGAFTFGFGDVVFSPVAAAIETSTAGSLLISTAGGDRSLPLPANSPREVAVTKVRRTNSVFTVLVYR